MNKILGAVVVAGMATGAGRVFASDDRWIHIRVDDAGDKGRVDIQVPLGLVSSLLPVLKNKHGDGSIQIDGGHVDVDDVRRYWNAVKASKDGEYVTVHDRDSDVKISKSGGILNVSVDDRGDRSRVRIKAPLPLVDAILSGGNAIDLDAVSGALAKAPMGDLLTVDDEDSHVKIWIDDGAAPAREDRP